MTIQEFTEKNRVRLTAERTDRNPAMPDWNDADHWKCLLTRREYTGKRYNARKDGTAIVARLTVYFSKGYGHKGEPPSGAEVLNCLAVDAHGIDNARGFEDWASDLGYDTDSRNAERIFKACERQSAKLKAFMGEDLYDELLTCEED